MSGLDQVFEDKRQVIFQSNKTERFLQKPVVNTRRHQALAKLGIAAADQNLPLLGLHGRLGLRGEDVLLVFVNNV